jgi:hypothetical protein
MKNLAIAFIMAMLSTHSFANDIYIEQVGDSSTISITQDGTGNKVGDSITPMFIGGGSNLVTINQVGGGNELAMVVNGAAAAVTLNTTGSNNTQDVQCGTTSSSTCSGSIITQTINGDDNTVTQALGDGANHESKIEVNGGSNIIAHTSTNSGTAFSDITVAGDTNNINVTQSGMTAKSVTVNSTGSLNNITITQSD